MDHKSKQQFIETWGSMGSLWGINTSMARVHALLMATEEPLGLDDIAKTLQISRGNASMCLKDLRNWGVVHKAPAPGDRKDYYVSENDVWKMFFRIARERKRRELDPAIESVSEVIAAMPRKPGGVVGERFRQMQELMKSLDELTTRFLKDDEAAKAAFSLFTSLSPGGK